YPARAPRLLSPMRRRPDGSYEAVAWDTAIREIAAKLIAVRDAHGGEAIFYYGGGGQGNHLPGAYASTSIGPLGVKYRSNALAQEKTGEFWVADRMFGGWPHGDFEHAEVVVFLGKNPWQSHGVHRARAAIREIAKDPKRTLIVIDPKRTESADLADIHLAVKPARDAWLLAGMAAAIVQEGLANEAWLARHASGLAEVENTLAGIDIADCAAKCGIDEAVIRSTARLVATAGSVAVLEDLGVQMNRHSTLVSYLQRLVWTLTGHFGRPGTHYIAKGLGRISDGREGGLSPVAEGRLIAGLVPCNLIASEILTDHPKRYRAMLSESANPVHSLADSAGWRQAMRALECSVVIDVAMTETALAADYVLPATTQFEKAEATFFNFEFPDNYFHLRHPLFTPPDGPLDEAEIHMRLAEAMGAVPKGLEAELNQALADGGRPALAAALMAKMAEQPGIAAILPGLLYRTLGLSLPDGLRNSAVLWGLSQRFAAANAEAVAAAGLEPTGDGLFDAILDAPSGLVVTRQDWPAVWQRLPGGKVELALPDLLTATATLNAEEPAEASPEYPFLLSAGERRSFTANTILRNPEWRRKDSQGALFINPEDAARLNLGEGSSARISTQAGSQDVVVAVNDRMQRGHVSLPNGLGLAYPEADGEPRLTGAAPNELTWSDLRDEYVGTPWHKSVPARVEAI
ncbi:MAG: molybdopterin-dependent oxidoreductase, partial [Gammaproteobacteria bacterium]|nr:molybdopterin-dependent oxidoreductase [Gammaproteobacteria bacterium]